MTWNIFELRYCFPLGLSSKRFHNVKVSFCIMSFKICNMADQLSWRLFVWIIYRRITTWVNLLYGETWWWGDGYIETGCTGHTVVVLILLLPQDRVCGQPLPAGLQSSCLTANAVAPRLVSCSHPPESAWLLECKLLVLAAYRDP